jgi:hypothetical protein
MHRSRRIILDRRRESPAGPGSAAGRAIIRLAGSPIQSDLIESAVWRERSGLAAQHHESPERRDLAGGWPTCLRASVAAHEISGDFKGRAGAHCDVHT